MSTDTARPGELREDDHYTTALYRAAIGPVGGAYYLPLFTQWELEHTLPLRWNWAAAFSTLAWLIFRKMGLQAIAYLAAVIFSVLLVFGIGPLFVDFSPPALWGWAGSLLLVSVVVPGLWANHWYHAACSKRMTAALKTHSDVAQACEALSQQASPRRRAWSIAGAQALVIVSAGLIAAQFAVWNAQVAPRTRVQDIPTSATASSPQTASGRVSEAAPAALPAALPASTAAVPAPPSSAATGTPPVLPASAPAKTASAPPAEPKAAPAAALGHASSPAVRPAVPSPKPQGAFGVNVGLFAMPDNAQTAARKIEAAQLPVLQDTLDMPRGPRIRVRAGPFESREKANDAAARIRALGLDAVVYGP
ncbi:MAG: hypothetical protein CFE44_13465 [Burkholderiales bacterium PBB4]|nr:MAG: hypothetical protein CFE44_13465 [Burkholderiales bacterium PBB4]